MLPEGTFKGKIALVTGGSSGMGRAVATELARLGSQVVVVARGAETLDALVLDLRSKGHEATGIPCNITDYARVHELVKQIVGSYEQIDIFVNCVGWGNMRRAEDL